MTVTPTFRFAPSPNGRLHLGHAYSALLNAQLARATQGRLLVRIEDIDTARCTPELATSCLEDLAWLGLTWETPVRVQSEHWQDYITALVWLGQRGLVYPCFCTRAQVEAASTAHDPDGAPLYPGTCGHLSQSEAQKRMEAGEPHSWRLHMGMALLRLPGPHAYFRFNPVTMNTERVTANPARWGDAILGRKDTPTSYHLSVVLDDALQQVTHVVRGRDLEAATDLHVLLQALLRLPIPLYYHHPLITEESGQKLAKSKGSETLADLRERGLTPKDIRRLLRL
ncbi:MAG: tRNA glutamyl-Q(34) synthetase GluQRS [Rickettsiales bacterium]|nr:tRNA glutamyl-Q(34) synthetase GluQRS [Rickettsiales bacterium]